MSNYILCIITGYLKIIYFVVTYSNLQGKVAKIIYKIIRAVWAFYSFPVQEIIISLLEAEEIKTKREGNIIILILLIN